MVHVKSSVKTVETPVQAGPLRSGHDRGCPSAAREGTRGAVGQTLEGLKPRRRMRLRLTQRVYTPPLMEGVASRRGDPQQRARRGSSQLGDPPRLSSTDQGVYTPSVPLARKSTVWW